MKHNQIPICPIWFEYVRPRLHLSLQTVHDEVYLLHGDLNRAGAVLAWSDNVARRIENTIWVEMWLLIGELPDDSERILGTT